MYVEKVFTTAEVSKLNLEFSVGKSDKSPLKVVRIYVRGKDFKSPLLIKVSDLYSFGLQETRFQDGFQIPFVLPKTHEFYKCLEYLQEVCLEYLDEHFPHAPVGPHFLPVWHKDQSKDPILYARVRKFEDKISLGLVDTEGNEIDPSQFMNRRFTGTNMIFMIHSLVIGATVKLSVKVIEVEAYKYQRREKTLLKSFCQDE